MKKIYIMLIILFLTTTGCTESKKITSYECISENSFATTIYTIKSKDNKIIEAIMSSTFEASSNEEAEEFANNIRKNYNNVVTTSTVTVNQNKYTLTEVMQISKFTSYDFETFFDYSINNVEQIVNHLQDKGYTCK